VRRTRLIRLSCAQLVIALPNGPIPTLHARASRNFVVGSVNGVSIAGWTRVRHVQRRLSIGLFNQAEELHGVQLGLLYFAGNNHGLARWTPFINLHLN
jgi:hypothetical protein